MSLFLANAHGCSSAGRVAGILLFNPSHPWQATVGLSHPFSLPPRPPLSLYLSRSLYPSSPDISIFIVFLVRHCWPFSACLQGDTGRIAFPYWSWLRCLLDVGLPSSFIVSRKLRRIERATMAMSNSNVMRCSPPSSDCLSCSLSFGPLVAKVRPAAGGI